MKIRPPKPVTSHQISNDEALRRCQTALDQKDRGDHEGAQETMRALWQGVGSRPRIKGLNVPVAAEVLLCTGILTAWIGSKTQIKGAAETGKNLITKAIRYFGTDRPRVAAAQVELAYCYWWNGEVNEARIMLREALDKLTTEGNTKAQALIKLIIIEHSSSRYTEALRILTENESLFRKAHDPNTKGKYHYHFAMTLEEIAAAEKRDDYFQAAVREYEKADHYLKLAKNPIYRASLKNNIAVLLLNLSRYKEAHKQLDEARRLTVSFKDKARTAQIDWTRAEVFNAEGKFKEAEAVARRAASALERGGQQCLVSDALTVQAIAVARQGHKERALFIFQTAIEAALQVDAFNKAGLAALTLIEEVDNLSPEMLQAAYRQAGEWLKESQSQNILVRLTKAAGKVFSDIDKTEATEIVLTWPCNLQELMLQYEKTLIRQALEQTNGSVTRAASLLGMSYQAVCYMIEGRHKDLLAARTPIRRRSKPR